MKYLVDTTVWVMFLRGMDERVKERLTVLLAEEMVFTTELIIMEILRGARSDKDYKMLHQDFLALPQLETDHYVWEKAWEISYKLRKNGVNVPLTDTMISTIAIHYGCTLLHSDKHFDMVAKYTELQTGNM